MMKKLLLAVLVAISSLGRAEPALLAYDPNSPAALEIKAQYARYEKEGQALQTDVLFAELERIDSTRKSRMALLTNPAEILAATWATTDDDMRSISYATVLQKRGEGGDGYASFFTGLREWELCQQVQRNSGDVWAKQARECWQRAMPAFKRASNAQIADASFNIGKMYENGFGVSSSKLVAAEWYVKSAEQYNKTKDRDEALAAVERAVNLVPDHPAALRLRKSMLK